MKNAIILCIIYITCACCSIAKGQTVQIPITKGVYVTASKDAASMTAEEKQQWVHRNFPGIADKMQKYITTEDGSSYIENNVFVFTYKTLHPYTNERLLTAYKQSDLLSIEVHGKENARKSTMYTAGDNTYLIIPVVPGDIYRNFITIFNKPSSTVIYAQVSYSTDDKAAGEDILKRLPEIIHFN